VESRAFGVFIFVPNPPVSPLGKGGLRGVAPVSKGEIERGSFDVAVPRVDRWTGEGYKDLEVRTENITIEDDLSRRDFTINAMAINLRTQQILDPLKGQEDLKNKVIKAVGKAEERFEEDPSRILRGIRFACQLGFAIDPETFEAMKKLAAEVVQPIDKLADNPASTEAGSKQLTGKMRVAEETIAKEFLKAFAADPVRTIKLYDEVGLLKILLPEVEAMKGVEQPANFHSEGDVYVHTLLALEKLKEEGRKDTRNNRSNNIQYSIFNIQDSIDLKLAILLHDIGKPVTFKSKEETGDRIRFSEHDVQGGKITAKIIKRLKLTVFSKDDPLHVDPERVVWLIKKHMILVYAKPEEMRLTKLEKYFFNPDGRSSELMALSYIDISATVPPSGKSDFSTYEAFQKKLDEVREQVKIKQDEAKLPPPLINGHDVIKALKIKPGPIIGDLLEKIREGQLAGKLKNRAEALDRLKVLSTKK